MNPLKSNVHRMCIEANPPPEVEWKRIETGYIIIHDLCEVTPTMRSIFGLLVGLAFRGLCLVALVISLVYVLFLQRHWRRKRLVF